MGVVGDARLREGVREETGGQVQERLPRQLLQSLGVAVLGHDLRHEGGRELHRRARVHHSMQRLVRLPGVESALLHLALLRLLAAQRQSLLLLLLGTVDRLEVVVEEDGDDHVGHHDRRDEREADEENGSCGGGGRRLVLKHERARDARPVVQCHDLPHGEHRLDKRRKLLPRVVSEELHADDGPDPHEDAEDDEGVADRRQGCEDALDDVSKALDALEESEDAKCAEEPEHADARQVREGQGEPADSHDDEIEDVPARLPELARPVGKHVPGEFDGEGRGKDPLHHVERAGALCSLGARHLRVHGTDHKVRGDEGSNAHLRLRCLVRRPRDMLAPRHRPLGRKRNHLGRGTNAHVLHHLFDGGPPPVGRVAGGARRGHPRAAAGGGVHRDVHAGDGERAFGRRP
mmetsp:Transcript_24382/g.71774  ORF Transcript_24382/g.71774 Transcript_24382/m.71774 type:complete len:405 (-) Transcript_24382:347-1561(-)